MLPADKPADSEGRMTNGSASDIAGSDDSRMSNGSVAEAGATSLTLQISGTFKNGKCAPEYAGSGVQGHR